MRQIKVGDPSPWGTVQDVENLGDGLQFVSTASHGGVWVPSERVRDMPRELKLIATYVERSVGFVAGVGGRWYEEDCDYSLVVLSFPELFQESMIAGAYRAAVHWHQAIVEPWAAGLPGSHPVTLARFPVEVETVAGRA
jgi:hypothetical protein